jgi:alpha(1,3/1,4) fucosyltransferase
VHSAYPILNKNSNLLRGYIDPTIQSFYEFFKEFVLKGEQKGFRFKSSFNTKPENTDVILYIDVPNVNDKFHPKFQKPDIKKFLWIWESPVIKPEGQKTESYYFFDKVFTYNRNILNSVIINYSFDQKKILFPSYADKNIKSNLIASNRSSNDKNELYTYRNNLIKYMNNSNIDFRLYGKKWHNIVPSKNIFDRLVNRFNLGKIYGSRAPKCFSGELLSKKKTIRSSVFTFCIENCVNDDFYISEKFFDSIKYGSIPIYLGCEQVEKLLPKNCFIDLRAFDSFERLEEFMEFFTEDDYNKYRNDINNALSNGLFNDYDIEVNVDRFLNGLVN